MSVMAVRTRHTPGPGCNNDIGTDAETDARFAAWRLGGQRCGNGDGKCITDFILLPAQPDLLPSAVENDSWGHIKASYMR